MANFVLYDTAGSGFSLQSGRFWSDLTISLGAMTYFEFFPTQNGQILYREYAQAELNSLVEMVPLSGSIVNTPRVEIYNSLSEIVLEASGLFTPWDLEAPAPLSPEQVESIQNNADLAAAFGLAVGPTPEYLSNQDLLEDALSGSDVVTGNRYRDIIDAGSGDDTLTGGLGNDLLDGGSGIDTAVYSGNQNSYSLTISPSSVTIADRRGDGNGTDTLVDIEFLDFDTELAGRLEPFNLQVFGGAAGLTAEDFESFIEFYIAYFNRAPDAVGLNFWGTAFANGVTLEDMATFFIAQEETILAFPFGASNSDFVTSVYDNVLGRIPDQDGFNFWVDMLNRSEETGVTPEQFILAVLRGVQDGSPDRAYLDSKVDIGAYFAVHRGMSDTDNAANAMALFDGSQGSVNDAVAAIDGYYQDALDPINGEFLMQVVGVLDNPFA